MTGFWANFTLLYRYCPKNNASFRIKTEPVTDEPNKQTYILHVHIIQCTVYCTLYTVHCLLYTVHCPLYSLRLHGLQPSCARFSCRDSDFFVYGLNLKVWGNIFLWFSFRLGCISFFTTNTLEHHDFCDIFIGYYNIVFKKRIVFLTVYCSL